MNPLLIVYNWYWFWCEFKWQIFGTSCLHVLVLCVVVFIILDVVDALLSKPTNFEPEIRARYYEKKKNGQNIVFNNNTNQILKYFKYIGNFKSNIPVVVVSLLSKMATSAKLWVRPKAKNINKISKVFFTIFF